MWSVSLCVPVCPVSWQSVCKSLKHREVRQEEERQEVTHAVTHRDRGQVRRMTHTHRGDMRQIEII